MQNKFIYVFSVVDKEKLLSSGFRLLSETPNKHSFVFENKEDSTFDLLDKSRYMMTNTLMF